MVVPLAIINPFGNINPSRDPLYLSLCVWLRVVQMFPKEDWSVVGIPFHTRIHRHKSSVSHHPAMEANRGHTHIWVVLCLKMIWDRPESDRRVKSDDNWVDREDSRVPWCSYRSEREHWSTNRSWVGSDLWRCRTQDKTPSPRRHVS